MSTAQLRRTQYRYSISVCLSVRPSVARWYCVKTTHRLAIKAK